MWCLGSVQSFHKGCIHYRNDAQRFVYISRCVVYEDEREEEIQVIATFIFAMRLVRGACLEESVCAILLYDVVIDKGIDITKAEKYPEDTCQHTREPL